MLFNSLSFLSIFLPVVFVVFVILSLTLKGSVRRATQLVWLILASLVFYGAWNPPYVALLLGSVGMNYWVGTHAHSGERRKAWLIFGITLNLLVLGYCKYADFFIGTLGWLFQLEIPLLHIVLPLAISFFTFQQIAYLMDCYRSPVPRYTPLEYAFFICFFPQLVAGPIVHHYEMLPQIGKEGLRLAGRNLCTGASIFLIGLFKKMVLADFSAGYANGFFDSVAAGAIHSAGDAWIGVLAYTFQIYFDFSGYSDMAIGLARMFGIVLPQNFNAPYRACNIAEFWRRWHITLSRFLRDYLYIPLGGNRKGRSRRYINLMVTMLLGGFWHGAAWTFVVWGGLHGLFLCIHRMWAHLFQNVHFPKLMRHFVLRPISWLLTMSTVTLAWVFFRAESFSAAQAVLENLAGLSGAPSDIPPETRHLFYGTIKYWWVGLSVFILLFLPTTQKYFSRENPVLEKEISNTGKWVPAWCPGLLHGLIMGGILFCVVHRYGQAIPTQFLYFNF